MQYLSIHYTFLSKFQDIFVVAAPPDWSFSLFCIFYGQLCIARLCFSASTQCKSSLPPPPASSDYLLLTFLCIVTFIFFNLTLKLCSWPETIIMLLPWQKLSDLNMAFLFDLKLLPLTQFSLCGSVSNSIWKHWKYLLCFIHDALHEHIVYYTWPFWCF